eukprot:Rmarinus@m.6961
MLQRTNPVFFHFLTTIALDIFASSRPPLDVVILEVGLGGRLDATNIVHNPVVCGITSLGLDHTNVLGNTLTEIAREKAGIFKKGVPALTVRQKPEAMEALQARAGELNIPLILPPDLETYGSSMKLSMQGAHQRENAALAVGLCQIWLQRESLPPQGVAPDWRLPNIDPSTWNAEAYTRGIESARLSGRAQILSVPLKFVPDFNTSAAREGDMMTCAEGPFPREGDMMTCDAELSSCETKSMTWYLDGAHTVESLHATTKWLQQLCADDKEGTWVLLFNCASERQSSLLEELAPLASRFSTAMFCPHNFEAEILPFEAPDLPDDVSTLEPVSAYLGNEPVAEQTSNPSTSSHSSVGVDDQTASVGGTQVSSESDGAGASSISSVRGNYLRHADGRIIRKDAILHKRLLADTWRSIASRVTGVPEGAVKCMVQPSVKDALRVLSRLQQQSDEPLRVVITGSLLLIGDLLAEVHYDPDSDEVGAASD